MLKPFSPELVMFPDSEIRTCLGTSILFFDYTAVVGKGTVGPSTGYPYQVTVVNPSAGRPKSVCNRCVIERFSDVFVLLLCFV